jgi:1-deoxy-D-xylulose-5-phosphate reductoisomerase
MKIRSALSGLPVIVMAGAGALSEVVAMPEVDIVLTAMVGFSGLRPTVEAVKHGKRIALANKETMVVAGRLITDLARKHRSDIYPVDSEHSAIFQCLAGEKPGSAERLILTASGGPFRGMTRELLQHVTVKQALNHPKWNMGNKITIDSATLMNKGLEVIEASWLFGMSQEHIDVIIHPQSIIHSMVQFTDGSIKAQMSLPDMRIPIQYALGYPERLFSDFPRFSFTNCRELTFEEPNLEVFRNLPLAYIALREGGNMPCILNAANEIAVEEFLKGRTEFLSISGIIEQVMEKAAFKKDPDLDDLERSDGEARLLAKQVTGKHSPGN